MKAKHTFSKRTIGIIVMVCCVGIGLLYFFIIRQTEEDLAYIRKKAQDGDAYYQGVLGAIYRRGEKGVTIDYDEALKWSQRSAEKGNPIGLYNLACLYKNDLGVNVDEEKAQELFSKAFSDMVILAEKGSARAQTYLAVMYAYGYSVEQDYDQAVYWYQKAAKQGLPHAQINLGHMYREGEGVSQDYEQAVYWYRKAADQGDSIAQTDLGRTYEQGRGVPQDDEQAVYWWRKAAEQNDPWGLWNLCRSYRDGIGVNPDMQEALHWCEKAAEQGHEEAQDMISELRAQLPPVPSEEPSVTTELPESTIESPESTIIPSSQTGDKHSDYGGNSIMIPVLLVLGVGIVLGTITGIMLVRLWKHPD